MRVGTSLTLITAPITAFLGTALKQASDQQTVLAQLESVLKSTGGAAGVTAKQVTDLSDSLAKVTRFSDDAILSAENLLLTFTSIGKDIFPDVTRAVLDLSTALGQDLKSSAIQIGKALNDPISGITALRRVGVQFTDAQEAQIKVLVESNDLLGAQTLILKELQKEFGGSAEAAGNTFAGKMDILNNKFGELQERVGFLLIPVLEKLIDIVGSVIETVTDWTDKNPQLARTIVLVAAGVAALGPVLIVGGTALIAISKILPVIKLAFSALLNPIGLVTKALALLFSPIGLIVAALAALYLAWETNFLGIRDLLQPVVDTITNGLGRIVQGVQMFIEDIQGLGFVDAIRKALDSPNDSWVEGILVGFGMARADAEKLVQSWAKTFEGVAPIVQKVVDFFRFLPGRIEVELNNIVGYVEYYFGKIWSVIEQQVIAPLKGLWTVVGELLKPLEDWFSTNLPTAMAAVGNALDLVRGTLQDLWNAAKPYVEPIVTWFQEAANKIMAFFEPIISFIQGSLDSIADTWEQVRRIGGGDPMRTLPGESAPGVKNPWVLTPEEQVGVDDWYAEQVRLKLLRVASGIGASLGTAIKNGATALADKIIEEFGKSAEATKTAALNKGIELGETTISKITAVTDAAHKGISSTEMFAYSTGATIGSAIGDALRGLGANALSGLNAGAALAYSIGAAIGQALAQAIAGIGAGAAAAMGGVGGAVGGVISTPGIPNNLPPGWVPFPTPTVPQGGWGGVGGAVAGLFGAMNYPGISGIRYGDTDLPSMNLSGAPARGSVSSYPVEGGKTFQWSGDLVVQGGGSVNVTREQVEEWMNAWYLDLDNG